MLPMIVDWDRRLPVHVPDEVWYRYEDVQYAGPLDEYDNPTGPGPVEVVLRTYPVLKHTSQGAWLRFYDGMHDRRWVSLKTTKRFACPTMEEAKVSFVARKRAQIRIHTARIRRAEKALEFIHRQA